MKKLLKTDIESAVYRVDEWKNCRLEYNSAGNGITNPNYIVTADNKNYFLKIPGAGTDSFIDRDNCHEANIIAMKSNSGPEVFKYYSDTGVEIWNGLKATDSSHSEMSIIRKSSQKLLKQH